MLKSFNFESQTHSNLTDIKNMLEFDDKDKELSCNKPFQRKTACPIENLSPCIAFKKLTTSKFIIDFEQAFFEFSEFSASTELYKRARKRKKQVGFPTCVLFCFF